MARHLNTVNLPDDRALLADLLELSTRSFGAEIALTKRVFLFVIEDCETSRVVGTSMIHAQHGVRGKPHIYFDVFDEERYSDTLDRHCVHKVLRLGFNYNGPTEIGGLAVLPDYRKHPEKIGLTISYARFLFIAAHREWFRDEVISELMPPLERDGTSKLWEALGRKFTGLSYQEADRTTQENKEFIRSLFPSSPIYATLLPEEVQAMIGVVGPQTRGVERMLQRVGFTYANRIDPFDGGPHVTAKTNDVSVVRAARKLKLEVGRVGAKAERALLGVDRPSVPRFRVCAVPVQTDATTILVGEDAAALLDVKAGDEVWTAALSD